MDTTNNTGVPDIKPGGIEMGESNFPCFRCGICCSKYQVRLNLADVRKMAEGLSMDLKDFIDKYIDTPWFGESSFLLRRDRASCVFLEQKDDIPCSLCSIHSFKPSSCCDWSAGIYKKECQEGLVKYWGITVNYFGQLQGPPDKIEEFRAFWKFHLPANKTVQIE